MPIIGVILGGLDFSALSLTFGDATINYGAFIQNVIDFLIVAACIFMFVKIINQLSKIGKKEEPKKEEPAPKKPEDIVLLEEIRDLLKANKKTSIQKTKKETKTTNKN